MPSVFRDFIQGSSTISRGLRTLDRLEEARYSLTKSGTAWHEAPDTVRPEEAEPDFYLKREGIAELSRDRNEEKNRRKITVDVGRAVKRRR